MESIVFTLLAFLVSGGDKEKRYIFDHVRPEYFEDEALSEIYCAACGLDRASTAIDLISLNEALTTDNDSEALRKRLKMFWSYFVKTGIAIDPGNDNEVKRQIAVLIATISTKMTYSTPVEFITRIFIGEYVGRAKAALMKEYLAKNSECPDQEITDELTVRMKALEALLHDDLWQNYVLDISTLVHEPDEVPLIFRKGQGFFYRGNLYLISGYAGAMKSFLALSIAASASNKGANADRTLNFYSTAGPLKVLMFDTELAKNTIKKRIKALMTMVPEIDLHLFKYVSLRMVPGDNDAKMKVFDDACRQFKPDVIVIDSGRDLCVDFNDNREADRLVAHFKQIATDLNAVVITTSHKSLGNGNAKGHFGMRLNEAAGLELSLKKDKEGEDTFVNVELPKQREDQYEPFSFRLDPEVGMLVEYTPTVDHKEEKRQFRMARETVMKILRPGETIRYNDLVYKLSNNVAQIGGKNVSERTAKNYIKALTGTILTISEDGAYRLADPNLEILYEGG